MELIRTMSLKIFLTWLNSDYSAKRARELTVGNQNMPQKEVSTALREIADDVITYERKVR